MPKNTNPPAAIKVTKQAWNKWLSLKKPLLWIALIASAVSWLLFFISGVDAVAVEIWSVVVLSVLVWFLSRAGGKKMPSIKEAFYEGSSSFLRQLLVMLVWLLYIIPFIVGAVLAQQVNMYQFGASNAELIGFNSIWLVLTLIIFYWLFRAWLAPLYVDEGQTPITALKSAWAFSRKRIGWVSRVLALVLAVSVVPLVAVTALLFLPIPDSQWVALSISMLTSFVSYAFTLPFLIAASLELKKHEPKKRVRRKK